MADFQGNEGLPLFSSGETPREPKTKRKQRFKTIAYSRSSKMYKTLEALAASKGLSIPQLLQKLGYTATSVNSSWLGKGKCPAKTDLMIKGWMAEHNLSVMIDKQGGYQVVKGASKNEKVPASVPLTAENVKDLIVLCATNSEEQLILPLAQLLGDGVTLTK